MSDINILIKDIDNLKKKLDKLVVKKAFNLQDPEVIKISQELDVIIAKYYDFYKNYKI